MALTHHHFLPSRIFTRRSNSYHKFSKPYLFLHCKTPNLLSLCATTNISQSSAPIFLPFLEEDDDERDEEEEDKEVVAELEQAEDPDDPIYKFFSSRTPTSNQDPQHEGKLSLQKNRCVSWHLASDTESIEETEIDLDSESLFVEEQEEIKDQKELPDGIVGEIVQIARNLPENLTLGEVLSGYEGRVGDTECLELLGFLGEEGRLLDCLYFFEWMRLQEPSLVTPRACTVLFPLLGRAGMGDKLLVLLRNLPSSKEFRDVHVYNAAISGLLCSGRYEILGTLT